MVFTEAEHRGKAVAGGLNQAWSCFKVVLHGSGTRINWLEYRRWRRIKSETVDERLRVFPEIRYRGARPGDWLEETEARWYKEARCVEQESRYDGDEKGSGRVVKATRCQMMSR